MKKIKSLRSEVLYWIHRAAIKIDPRIEMARCYHKIFGVWPNFKEPKTLVEKIYWLQLNTDTSLWSICADKYKVRNILVEKGLGDYLNELYGVWERVDDINFELLPSQCVLKTNNGCGQICYYDRDILDSADVAKKKLGEWLRHPFGVSGGELHYLKIKPLVIAEKQIPIPEGEKSLVDYKIWCFGGEPFCILVVYGRTKSTVSLALFDLEWNPMPQYLQQTRHSTILTEKVIQKPDCLENMLQIARTLSADFPEVRVDLYNVDNRPMFGEMTFSTGFGYFTDDFYRILGDKVVLPINR